MLSHFILRATNPPLRECAFSKFKEYTWIYCTVDIIVDICTGRGWKAFNRQIQGPSWAMDQCYHAPKVSQAKNPQSFRQTRYIAIDFSEQLFQSFVAWLGWNYKCQGTLQRRKNLDRHGQNWIFVVNEMSWMKSYLCPVSCSFIFKPYVINYHRNLSHHHIHHAHSWEQREIKGGDVPFSEVRLATPRWA